MTSLPSTSSSNANRTGLYLGVLHLVFTLGWTTYVIYLPKLAADVGIAPASVILILMLDQAIFTIMDTAMGLAADRTFKKEIEPFRKAPGAKLCELTKFAFNTRSSFIRNVRIGDV